MMNVHQQNLSHQQNMQQRIASLHRLAQNVKLHTASRPEPQRMIPAPEEVFDDARRAAIEAMLDRRPTEANDAYYAKVE